MLQYFNAFLSTLVHETIHFPDTDSKEQRECSRNDFAKFFIFLFLLAVIVYARAIFFPVLGIDTYTYALSEGRGDIYFEILRGTWSFAALNQLVPGPLVAPFVSMLFFLATTTTVVFLVTIFWTRSSPQLNAYITGSVMILFPYWASQAYFNYYHYGFALSTMMGTLAVILPWHSGGWRRCLVATACFVFGVSLYQGAVTTATGLAGASLLVAMQHCYQGDLAYRSIVRSILRVGLVLLVGSGAYMLLHTFVKFAAGMPSLGGGYYAVNFNFSISRLMETVHLVFTGSPLLLPKPALWLLCVPAFVFCWAWLGPQRKNSKAPSGHEQKQPQRSRLALLALPPLLALAIVSPLSLSLVQNLTLASRSTVSIAFVWAMIFFLAASVCQKWGKNVLIFATVLICILFAGRINYVWQLQTLTTEADMSDARRMYQRVYDLPEFSDAPKPIDIAFAGCISEDARSWPQDRESIFGLSQFACFGDRIFPAHAGAVLRFVGAHIKTVPLEASDIAAVATRKPWPAVESVFWNKDHFVIWLGPTKRKISDMRLRLQWIKTAMGISVPAISTDTAEKGGDTPLNPLHPLLERMGQGKAAGTWPGHALRPVTGFIDAQKPVVGNSDHVQVTGWAFDLVNKEVPQFVALLNCQGQIAGLAATGILRTDLLHKVAVDAEYAGFDGFALADEKICTMAY